MTQLQTDRRRNPYPYTWELPLGLATTWLLLAAITVQAARSLANWAAGAGWDWPTGRALYTSLPAILAGNPRAGLTPDIAATPTALYGWIITSQLLLAAATLTAAVWAWRRWGPGRMKGMATATETEQVLGATRLRKAAPIIRPDLHPSTRRTP